MSDVPRASAIRGSTMRWNWADGPTKGKSYEHIFHDDGTVEWHEVGGAPAKAAAGATAKRPERVPYAAFEVTPDVYAVSYLAESGFTLTTVVNFATGQMVGFASGNQQWMPLRGTVERVR
jgi:hypothetical protein